MSLSQWIPNDPPTEPSFFGVDRSVAPARFDGRPLDGRPRGPGRFRWWLGYKLHALATWVLGGIP